MLELAAARLGSYDSRVQFTQADLTTEDWGEKISRPVGVIVETWALHDLGGEMNTPDCLSVLSSTPSGRRDVAEWRFRETGWGQARI